MRYLTLFLVPFLLTACIQEAQWTWTGDTPGDTSPDQVTADGSVDLAPADLPGADIADTDVPVPFDTTDTVEPTDTDAVSPVDTTDTVEPFDTDTVQTDTIHLDTEDIEDVCVPDCDGKDCGDDGCGGTCGVCTGGSFCEGIETCQDGVCVQDEAPNCDDGNPCTDDSCDPEQAACTHALKPLDELIVEDCLCDDDEDCEPLEDGNFCNGTLVCDFEAETPTCKVDDPTVIICDALPEGAHPECNVPACDPDTGGCVALAANEDEGCSDEDACTADEHCVEGVCVGTLYDCDTPGQCESADGATCNGDGTCTYPTAPLDGMACDDGNACNQGELCTGGACFGGSEVSCDDGNQCTEDSCDTALGCQNEPTYGASCDDGEFCSTGDTCKGADGSVCEGSGWESCDDGNPCTNDQCIPDGEGCYNSPQDGACDDGNECTVETCTGGACVPDPEPMNGFECDDGTECTFNDACFDGECLATPAPEVQLEWLDCFCSEDADCDIVDDGTQCNGDVSCVGVKCLPGLPVPCDDSNPCTDDVCDPGLGCVFPDNADPCQDGDPCTEGDHCEGGVCVAGPDFVCDLDHDGVCLSLQCPTLAPDNCPTVWNPDADDGICAPLPDTFPASRALTLSQQGAPGENSTWRRTYEVVEIPLKNGVLDNSVVAYWKLDGDCSDSSGTGSPCEEKNEPDPIEGAFGDGNGAFYFDTDPSGTGKPFLKTGLAIEWGAETSFAVMLWAKANGTDGSIGGGGCVFGTNKTGSELHLHVAHPSVDFAVHIRDEDGNSIDVEHNEDAFPDKNWHHYACVRNAQDRP